MLHILSEFKENTFFSRFIIVSLQFWKVNLHHSEPQINFIIVCTQFPEFSQNNQTQKTNLSQNKRQNNKKETYSQGIQIRELSAVYINNQLS